MMDKKEKRELKEAIRCCRVEGGCEQCPLQLEICDELVVEMENIPAGLMDLIEEALEDQ